MRLCLALGLLVVCLCGAGCNLAARATHNTAYDTCCCFDQLKECSQYYKAAEQAWLEAQAELPEPVSLHYAKGFKEGYADFLDAGGNGQPPPVPPSCYWKTCYQTPAGREAIQDWFAGFRHGTSVAVASGARQLTTLPSSLQLPSPHWPPFTQLPAATPGPYLPPPSAARPARLVPWHGEPATSEPEAAVPVVIRSRTR